MVDYEPWARADHCVPGTGIINPACLGTGTASGSTFLRGDQTWAAPTAGASWSATSVTVAYGPTYAEATVNDAAITAQSRVVIAWGQVTDADVNTPDVDRVDFQSVCADGSMTVRLSSLNPLGGPYKLNYMVG